jgi:transcription antitermination factor NusA-like protein
MNELLKAVDQLRVQTADQVELQRTEREYLLRLANRIFAEALTNSPDMQAIADDAKKLRDALK